MICQTYLQQRGKIAIQGVKIVTCHTKAEGIWGKMYDTQTA